MYAARAQYTWQQREDGGHDLGFHCGRSGNILALYAAPIGDFVVIGARPRPPPAGPAGSAPASDHRQASTQLAALAAEAAPRTPPCARMAGSGGGVGLGS